MIRYTLTAPADQLAKKVLDTMAQLEKAGYKTTIVKNTWDAPNASYRGINTTVESPDGIKFELQYHTPESYAMKDRTHILYEQQRVLDPEDPQAIALAEQMMREVASLQRPDGVEQIVSKNDYK